MLFSSHVSALECAEDDLFGAIILGPGLPKSAKGKDTLSPKLNPKPNFGVFRLVRGSQKSTGFRVWALHPRHL